MSLSKSYLSSPTSSPRSYYSTSDGTYSSGDSPLGASPTSVRSSGSFQSSDSASGFGAPHLPNDFDTCSHSSNHSQSSRASVKALKMMNQNKPKPTAQSSHAARQAAIRRYEEKRANRAMQRANELCNSVMVPTRKEKLAESSRQKKIPTPEEDFESMDDLKGSGHRQRQLEAQKRALQLLDSINQGMS